MWEWYENIVNKMFDFVYPVLSEQLVTAVTSVLHALQVFEILIPVVPDSLQAQVGMIIHVNCVCNQEA